MGDLNQRACLKHWVPNADGPVLEVGSKEYGLTASFRDPEHGERRAMVA